MERLCGVETEYAFTALDQHGCRIRPEHAVCQLIERARRHFPHLPGHDSSGIFLASGSRLYIDCQKPELATPECADPTTVCRYYLAGGQILSQLAQAWIDEDPAVAQAFLTTSNVSYAGNGTTWAAHESYGHRAALSVLAAQIMSHLATRQILCGGGGFDNTTPGIQFMLSPRVAHLHCESSNESTNNRGIFHTKNEPLNNAGYSRLHVLCGESLCSETALWLKIATTALIVALIEAGKKPGDKVRLGAPLDAMRRFAIDTELTATVESFDHKSLTALDIQRHYLEMAERFQNASFMPSWAPEACCLWRDVLDRLQHGPAAVQTTLDWAIKWILYQNHAHRRGIDWRAIPLWSKTLVELHRALNEQTPADGPWQTVTREVLANNSPVRSLVRKMTPLLHDQDQNWEMLEPLLALRLELFELDTRFGQLNEQGLFISLDRAGALDHHVPGVDDIATATQEPPTVGRARLRGQWIKHFAGRSGQYRCDWSGVWDLGECRYLDLSDPFVETETWQKLDSTTRVEPTSHTGHLRLTVRRALEAYDRGHYESAAEWLRMATELHLSCGPHPDAEVLRYTAWVQSRRGFIDGAAALDQLASFRPHDLVAICDYVCNYRFQGLLPAPEMDGWLQRGLDCLTDRAAADSGTMTALLGHYGYWLLCQNRAEQALTILRDARDHERFLRDHVRCRARVLAELAEAYFQTGAVVQARQLLDESASLQIGHQFEGDLADFALTRRAKIESRSNLTAARELLRKAKEIQIRIAHRMGEARTWLLEARLANTDQDAELLSRAHHRVLELRNQRPALAQCRLLNRILAHWDDWTTGQMPTNETDYFWHL